MSGTFLISFARSSPRPCGRRLLFASVAVCKCRICGKGFFSGPCFLPSNIGFWINCAGALQRCFCRVEKPFAEVGRKPSNVLPLIWFVVHTKTSKAFFFSGSRSATGSENNRVSTFLALRPGGARLPDCYEGGVEARAGPLATLAQSGRVLVQVQRQGRSYPGAACDVVAVVPW